MWREGRVAEGAPSLELVAEASSPEGLLALDLPEEGPWWRDPEGLLTSEALGELWASLKRTTFSFCTTNTDVPGGRYRTQYAPVLDDFPRLHWGRGRGRAPTQHSAMHQAPWLPADRPPTC